MKKLTTLIIAALLGSGIVWADEEATQNTQETQNTQSEDTFQPYQKANKKQKNKSGVFVGADLGVGFSGNNLKYIPGSYVIDDSGTSVSAFGDLKVGYKYYFTKEFALRGYGSLGYGGRFAAVNYDGMTLTQTTTALRIGVGADAIYDVSKSFGVFAGFGLEGHLWTHPIGGYYTSSYTNEDTGNAILPKLQIGIISSGFEVGLVYYTSAIQPANGLLNYQNDIALKVGYTYTFAL